MSSTLQTQKEDNLQLYKHRRSRKFPQWRRIIVYNNRKCVLIIIIIMVITARTVLMNPVKREYMTHSRSYRSNLLLTAVHSIVCSVNRPVQVKPIQGHHILITSIRISLLVSTQFSSGNVSHRWSKVAMLSLKPDKFNLLRWCQYSP